MAPSAFLPCSVFEKMTALMDVIACAEQNACGTACFVGICLVGILACHNYFSVFNSLFKYFAGKPFGGSSIFTLQS